VQERLLKAGSLDEAIDLFRVREQEDAIVALRAA
jgi:hypothetical protein